MGGTTGPFMALQFLTLGKVDMETGVYRAASGVEKFYVATDNLSSTVYRGLLPEDFMDILAGSEIGFDHEASCGVGRHRYWSGYIERIVNAARGRGQLRHARCK